MTAELDENQPNQNISSSSSAAVAVHGLNTRNDNGSSQETIENSHIMGNRGLFIVIEGCDRSGKTTQCEMLVKTLESEGRKVKLQKFPDRTTATGLIIDQYLKSATELDDHAIHLLFSANRWEAMAEIKRNLESGTNIIVDRYAFSGVAFSAAKEEYQASVLSSFPKGLDLNWCKQCDVGLLKPDLILFLDLEPYVAQQRGEYGQERYEKLEFQTKARNCFLAMKDEDWTVIDANQTIESLHEQMYSFISSEIQSLKSSYKQRPLQNSLWQK